MKKILLIGIAGVYNYGCEAIVRGTVNVLKEKYPNCKIFYASRRAVDDKNRLKGCDVEIIEASVRKWTIENILRKLLTYIKIDYFFVQEDKSILNGIDEVYSIGGDIYTLNAYGSFSKFLPLFGDYCIKKGIKYILWGCSIGPFDKNKKALDFFKKHLKNITKIYAREKETVEYLKTLGVEVNVELIIDPGFSVAIGIKKLEFNKEIKRIGINLSPLSALHFYKSLDEAISLQVKWICAIINEFNCNISLLPHVISESIKDDDYRYLQKIYNALPANIKTRVELADTDPGFIGIKQIIIKCDVVLAARMHCAVNSIVTNTPVVFLAYSKKAIGMANYIYGNDKYVFKLNDLMSKEFMDSVKEVHKIDLSKRSK